MQKKSHLEMIAPTLLESVFKFLNTYAHLNIILLWLSSSNSGFACFFLQKCIWLGVFFTRRRLFSLNGHLLLFSVKLSSAQKFMTGCDISITLYPRICQIPIVIQCCCWHVAKCYKLRYINKIKLFFSSKRGF